MARDTYLGDESARLRFLREARAAASVRHPKRSAQIEVKLAVEIAAQVAAGLSAVHKQKLVHRDIKPSNIMVNVDEGGAVTVKIIDLGLAKTVNEPGSQTSISMPGGFVGTPDFASPEQFAGVQIDIRSDLRCSA